MKSETQLFWKIDVGVTGDWHHWTREENREMSDTIKANSSNKYEEYYKRKADTSTMTSIRLNESTDTTHNVRKDTREFTKISTGTDADMYTICGRKLEWLWVRLLWNHIFLLFDIHSTSHPVPTQGRRHHSTTPLFYPRRTFPWGLPSKQVREYVSMTSPLSNWTGAQAVFRSVARKFPIFQFHEYLICPLAPTRFIWRSAFSSSVGRPLRCKESLRK